jgi:hypothetical protein
MEQAALRQASASAGQPRGRGKQADEASAGQSAEREICFFSGLPRLRGLPAFGSPANGPLATQWLAASFGSLATQWLAVSFGSPSLS